MIHNNWQTKESVKKGQMRTYRCEKIHCQKCADAG